MPTIALPRWYAINLRTRSVELRPDVARQLPPDCHHAALGRITGPTQ